MSKNLAVDPVVLREEVKSKYRDVAINPSGEYHFHTGRLLAKRLGYDSTLVDSMPDAAVESFAGVANPFSLRSLERGEKVVDAGSGGGFDSFVAAHQVGPEGRVVGVDMLPEMLAKSRRTAEFMGIDNVEFREGLLEEIPLEDRWADVVITNGVINLCADKRRVFSELSRVLRPGGRLQFGDIANGKPGWRCSPTAASSRFRSANRMTPSAKPEEKRRPGSLMFMDTRSWHVNPDNIRSALNHL